MTRGSEWIATFGILGPAEIGKSIVMARLCELGHWIDDVFCFNSLDRLIQKSNATEKKSWRKLIQNRLKGFAQCKHEQKFLVAAAHFFKYDDRGKGREASIAFSCFAALRKRAWVFQEVQDTSQKLDECVEVFQGLLAKPMRALDAKLQGVAERILIGFDALDECVQRQQDLLKILQHTWIQEFQNELEFF